MHLKLFQHTHKHIYIWKYKQIFTHMCLVDMIDGKISTQRMIWQFYIDSCLASNFKHF